MNKSKTLLKLQENGLVAVVRGKSKEEGIAISRAIIEGNLNAIEVAYTTPNASEVIADLQGIYKDNDKIIIGAGTVLDAITAKQAIDSGAEFVVSPSFDRQVAEICNTYLIPYLPGCMTMTEINTALKAGVDIIKVFPGDILGAQFIKDVKGPLPYVNLMPTGGVNLDNMKEWFENGVVAVGVGGNLTKGFSGDYTIITKNAKLYVDRLNEIRG